MLDLIEIWLSDGVCPPVPFYFIIYLLPFVISGDLAWCLSQRKSLKWGNGCQLSLSLDLDISRSAVFGGTAHHIVNKHLIGMKLMQQIDVYFIFHKLIVYRFDAQKKAIRKL